MSYLVAAPQSFLSAASDLSSIGSTLTEANGAAATSTTSVVAAAEDEVSAAVASLFSSHGKAFQMLSAQAAEFHSQFVQALNAGAGAYAGTEAANAGPLQTLEQTLAQDLPAPNLAVSVGGLTLLQSGSAPPVTAAALASSVLTSAPAPACNKPTNWLWKVAAWALTAWNSWHGGPLAP